MSQKKNAPDWVELERKTREFAAALWQRPAVAKVVAGVRLDCVLELESNYWILVEISKSDSLEKLRTDLAKFAAARPALMAQGIMARCYFVCDADTFPSIRETGAANHVSAMSFTQFATQFFDFPSYRIARNAKPFGSAIDARTGQSDSFEYVPVRYLRADGTELDLKELVGSLATGKKIVMTGAFGAGKSRAFRELFSLLANDAADTARYPIAINLRENWGLRRASEIVRRHFEDLGLSNLADAVLRIYDKHSVVLLLDGFDELGSQTWSNDPRRLVDLRKQAVSGVKELIRSSSGGVLISGREHYFNGDVELATALGLEPGNTQFVRCHPEFTSEQMTQYLALRGKKVELPKWLPRRPVICQVIADLPQEDLDRLSQDAGGDPRVCKTLVEVICERESRISEILDPVRIQGILKQLSRTTRQKPGNVGPVTVAEINRAFETVVGSPPNDESAIMLQRLPGLGRFSAESADREFVDDYILEGLRALDVAAILRANESGLARDAWMHPLKELGQRIVAAELDDSSGPANQRPELGAVRFAKECARLSNAVLAGDIVASVARCECVGDTIDFGFEIRSATFGPLDFTDASPKNLTIDDSIIDDLYLPLIPPEKFVVRKCTIDRVHRVSAATGLPSYIVDCDVAFYDAVSTTAQIKDADLDPGHRILVAMVKKTFLQKGGARKEEALTRGLGAIDKKLVEKILKLLVRENILAPAKGDEGTIYVPQRSETKRMNKMLADLRLSKDPLWLSVAKL